MEFLQSFMLQLLTKAEKMMQNILNYTCPSNYDFVPLIHTLFILEKAARATPRAFPLNGTLSNGMILSIKGFEAPAYGVRNASQLLFQALLQRCIGSQRNAQTSFEDVCIASEFFGRLPKLLPFVCNVLKTAIERPSKAIQPVLLLLAKLRPTLYSNDDIKVEEQLIPHLKSLTLRLHEYSGRDLASRALVVLTKPSQVIQV